MRSIDQTRLYTKDLAACRDQLRVGSRSFHAAAFLLPRSFCEPASALYAFCRIADDAVDNDPDPEQALARLHELLNGAIESIPECPGRDKLAAMAHAEMDRLLPAGLRPES